MYNRENNLHKIVHTEISAHYLEFIYLLSHEVNKETQHQAGFSEKSGKKKKILKDDRLAAGKSRPGSKGVLTACLE